MSPHLLPALDDRATIWYLLQQQQQLSENHLKLMAKILEWVSRTLARTLAQILELVSKALVPDLSRMMQQSEMTEPHATHPAVSLATAAQTNPSSPTLLVMKPKVQCPF